MIPDYLNEEIDILSDSVLEICEKAAYKAHEGTYVEGLWDAAPSTIISKVSGDLDWQPLTLDFHTHETTAAADPGISDVPEYCLRTRTNPFYGYSSEPPVTSAFKEARPVGIATTALQALGTLQALLLAEDKKEEVEVLNDTFCAMWGADKDVIMNSTFYRPELASRSRTDIIKQLRSGSHRVYGYENEQSYVTVTGGGYTRGTLDAYRYVDWHRIYLVMRYVGISMALSDGYARDRIFGKEFHLLYGLVAREFPLVTNSPHLPYLKGVVSPGGCKLMSNALRWSLDYYTTNRVADAIKTRDAYASRNVILSEDLNITSFTLAKVRASLDKPRTAIKLDFTSQARVAFDIEKPGEIGTKRTLLGQLSKLDIHHQISPMRACELAAVMKLSVIWGTAKQGELRDLIDLASARKNLEFTETDKQDILRSFQDLVGPRYGSLASSIIRKFRRDRDMADHDLLVFIHGVARDESLHDVTNWDWLFSLAFRTTASYSVVLDIFVRAHRSLVHLFLVTRLPTKALTANLNPTMELQGILANLWSLKRDYWVGHYKGRMLQCMKVVKEGNDGLVTHDVRKRLIRYQWLVKWLPHYSAKVTAEFEVWPEIDPKTAFMLAETTARNFLRKKKNETIVNTSNPSYHYLNFCKYFDDTHSPDYPLYAMAQNVHSTAKEMTRDLAHVLRAIIHRVPNEDARDPLDVLFDEHEAAEKNEEASWLTKAVLKDSVQSSQESTNEVQLAALSAGSSNSETEEEDAGEDLEQALDSEAIEEGMERAFDAEEYDAEAEYAAALAKVEAALDEETSVFDLGDAMDFSFSMDVELPKTRNVSAELYDDAGRIPDLNAWARMANCEIEDLRMCSQETYGMLLSVGKDLLNIEAASREEEKEDEEFDIN